MLRVLIIDDDEDDRDLFCDGVHDLSCDIECMIASHGGDALYKLHSPNFSKPDIIFLDLNMPRVNGVQFLEMVKKDKALKSIPIVIYTTSKSKVEERLCLSLGAAQFITKPSRLSEFTNSLNGIFKAHQLVY